MVDLTNYLDQLDHVIVKSQILTLQFPWLQMNNLKVLNCAVFLLTLIF